MRRKPEDFCGFRAENNKPGLSADAKPALSRAILGEAGADVAKSVRVVKD